MTCSTCAALLARIDQLEAEVLDLAAREGYWRQQAVVHCLEVMERDGEVERGPDGRWDLTGCGRNHPQASATIRDTSAISPQTPEGMR